MTNFKGLEFKKIDLHVHTPASEDYKDKRVTPEEIVDTAISNDLAAIAITDHQTADLIDDIKKAAENKPIVIFPGVEVLAPGGEEGVHILIIFDTNKDSNHVSQFLNRINIHKRDAGKASITENTVGPIADELEKYDSSAIIILAHCHSSKGVLGDIKGETRKNIFSGKRNCILGAEANESNFLDTNKKNNKKRVIDLLDGTDPNFNKMKLGILQNSDAHSLEEIGSGYTYLKLDEPIDIEDVRQSLIDRDTRIKQPFEYEEKVYPRINEIRITSGFLKDQVATFHEGLNSILGAKGSGKSLIIEFLRFAFNRQPKDSGLKEDHESKLEKCLKLHGEVSLVIKDESGSRYRITRVYNPEEHNLIEITDLSNNELKSFDIENFFPILFLSQNEVIKIAEDKTGKNQRDFIDNFFDFHKYRQRIDILNEQLKETDNAFSDIIKANLKEKKLQKRLTDLDAEIDKINKQIKNDIFLKYSKEEKVGLAINSQLNFFDVLLEELENTIIRYDDFTKPESNEDFVNENPAYKRTSDFIDNTLKRLSEGLNELKTDLESLRIKIDQEYNEWKKGFQTIKSDYNDAVKNAGGNQAILDQKRTKITKEIEEFKREIIRLKNKSSQIKDISKKRIGVLDNLESAYEEYFNERKNRCNYFTEKSGGSLNVTITEKGDKSAFQNNLLKFKRGSWLKDSEIKIISEKVSPRELIGIILNYELNGRQKIELIEDLSVKTEIPTENVKKLIEYFLDEYEYTDIFSLVYNSAPEDVPSINYKVGSAFKNLNELSVGQKAIALLIIALSDGDFPIIIDQPEDSLDLRAIWEDVCKKLRKSKENRQFIFTTHNSSVAVASDTDKFTILQSDASSGKIIHSGSINKKVIKKEVIDYLEGGELTYISKRQKYNL